MKMIDVLKEETYNSLKEVEKKTNQKLQEINKSLRTSRKSRKKKTIILVKKTVQGLKIEIESMNKHNLREDGNGKSG